MAENKKQQIQQEIAAVNEPETCKQARVKVLETLGNDDYQQYFENPNKCKFITNNIGDITVELLGSAPWNFYIIKERLKKIGIKVEWISNEIKVEQENGYIAYCMAKSFEELKTLSALYSQQKVREIPQDDKPEDDVSEPPFWKRAFKPRGIIPKEQKKPATPMTMEELQQLKTDFKKRFGTGTNGTDTSETNEFVTGIPEADMSGTNNPMPDISKASSNAKAYNADVSDIDKSDISEYSICNLMY